MAGLLQTVFAPRRRRDSRSRVIAGVHPSGDWGVLSQIFGRGATAAGIDVDEWVALQFSVVWACVNRISDDVAKLPLRLYRRLDEQARTRESKHPASALVVRKANGDMITPFDFRNTLQGHTLLWGNAYCEIERTGRGRPVALWPLKPTRMRVERVGGKVVYRYRRREGREVELPRDDVLHLHGLGFDGVMGYNVIRMAMESVGAAIAAERFGADFFGNSAQPSGLLKMKGKLDDDEQAKRLKESWKEVYGKDGRDRQGVAVLEEDMTFERLTVPPDEAQFLQTRQFMIPEICRWFGMPPHKVGDLSRATFSNIEHQDLAYLGDTLLSWLIRWEQKLNLALLLPEEQDEYFFEFDTNAFVRSDVRARHEAYAIARQHGWMNADEIRARENMNPLPDGQGQIYTVPVNMTTPEHVAAGDNAPEPPKEPTDKQKLKKLQRAGRAIALASGLAQAFEPLLNAGFRQLHRLEGDRARRASKKGELAAHLETFYVDHAEHLRAAVMPVADGLVRMLEESVGPPNTPIDLGAIALQIAQRHVARSIDELRRSKDVEATTNAWGDGTREAKDAAEDMTTLARSIVMHWIPEDLS